MRKTRNHLIAGLFVAFVCMASGRGAEAQLGGLTNKLKGKAGPSTGQPVFDNVILELTPQRIANILAGKNAGKALLPGSKSPSALRMRAASLEEQQTKIYEKEVDNINAWDEQRRDAERCRDSVLADLADKAQAPLMNPRAIQLAMELAQAQAKGDSAEIRRIAKEMEKLNKPSAADSAGAAKACPVPPPPALVKQYLDLQSQIDSLREEIAAAEAAISKAEEAASGMNARQLAMACERVKMYLEVRRNNVKQTGFTQAELDAIDQAIKDLEAACT